MSRVRVLNLPSDCTEERLKNFILEGARKKAAVSPSVPEVVITDVRIVRAKSSPSQQQRQQRRSGQTAQRGHPANSKLHTVPAIRMAFLGFTTTAAAKFVISHFDRTFFHSNKITVELAKSVGSIEKTLNMALKEKRLEKANGGTKRRREGDAHGQDSDAAAGEGAQHHPSTASTDVVDGPTKRPKTEKELFISERLTKSGPSWASDLPVPAGDPSSADAEEGTMETTALLTDAELTRRELEEKAREAEREAEALRHQQQLGAVSDADFLAMLTTETTENVAELHPAASHQHGETPTPTMTAASRDAEETKHASHGKETASGEQNELDLLRETLRLRVLNIPYTATESDVKQFFTSTVSRLMKHYYSDSSNNSADGGASNEADSRGGSVVQHVHIPLTSDTRQSKGTAYVTFTTYRAAEMALLHILRKNEIFMGRPLRGGVAPEDPYSILAAQRARELQQHVGEFSNSLKNDRLQEVKRKEWEATVSNDSSGIKNWNTLYMNSPSAVNTVAKKLDLEAGQIVSKDSKGAAVRAALAESLLTRDHQTTLAEEAGIDMDALASNSVTSKRSSNTIVVKNIEINSDDEGKELLKLFKRFGEVDKFILASSGLFALVRFFHPQDARTAFTRLSYKKVKLGGNGTSPLFLEWAPLGSIKEDDSDDEEASPTPAAGAADGDTTPATGSSAAAANASGPTVFLSNIPFNITEEDLYTFISDQCPRFARALDKHITKLTFNTTNRQQKGYAFLRLGSEADVPYVIARLHNSEFHKRKLICERSKMATPSATETDGSPSTGKPVAVVSAAGDDEIDTDAEPVRHTRTAAAATVGASASASKVPAGCDPLKIIVKNLPFEATEKDLNELFSSFSEIKSVRLPKKINNFSISATQRNNYHRGFAFVEFLSEVEAAKALQMLSATHLYGRHLVLQYAKLDD